MTEKAENTARLSSEEKRALLNRLLRAEGREGKPLPLSFTQQRLWFIEQLTPGSSAYHIRLGFSLEGKLNTTALWASLDEIARRHEPLRAIFSSVNGQPLQIIARRRAGPVTEIDLSGLSERHRLITAEEIASEQARRPFDFQRELLWRAGVLGLDAERRHFLLTMNHIISDGWSMELFYRELSALYGAFITGQPSPLPEPKIQFADYANWQRARMQGEFLEDGLAYWKRQLSGAPSFIELPTDRPRPAIQSFRGKRQALTAPKEIADGLRELSRREGATLFMTLLAAFKALLFKYSGQSGLVIGTPIANRNRAELEGIIGPLVNTLALRSELHGDATFRELLGQVKQTALGAYAHQEIPFDLLMEHLDVKRDISRHPIFQVFFTVHEPPAEKLRFSGIAASRIPIAAETTKFDLNLTMMEVEQGARAVLEYSIDLFDDATIERILRHFERLLEGVSALSDRRISELPLLSAAEKEQILIAWNDTARNYAKEDCLHHLFERQAELTPDRIAAVYEEEQVSYERLNRIGEWIASLLLSQGINPEDRVAVLLDRSIEMVAAVLGILKAGGAYLPLDPAYPAQRIGFMLDDSRASILMTQSSLQALPPSLGTKTLLLDADSLATAEESTMRPQSGIAPENLAYVIYTSGSTGTPKGTQIAHAAVVNFLNSMQELTGIGRDDILLAVTTLSFDIAGLELYLPLSVGARLEIARRQEAGDGESLSCRMTERRVTVMQATPASWRLLLQSDWADWPGAERENGLQILCGGEAMPPELARRLEEKGRIVWNMYGPTETTIWSAAEKIETAERGVTLGRPIANTQIHILDERLEVVPIGVIGEIYIDGSGVGRGYWNGAEKTAERFIPCPWSSESGARMYRTGDTGRRLRDGRIRYEGRIDHQVKLRGYRIELAEIEAVLNQSPAVSQSVAALWEDDAGEKRLAAYVVGTGSDEVRINELKEHVRERLPGYMAPSQYVVMRSFPLTPNGKIDRKALPEPGPMQRGRDVAFAAPRNEIEEILAGIWSRILGAEQVGVEDSFFDLGGHSLLATQLMSRIRQTLQVEIPLRSVFESPTVAGLAARIAADRMRDEGVYSPPITPVPRDRNIPASFSQSREWFLQRLEPETAAYNIPTALVLKGKLSLEALNQSVNEIVRRHESLRTSFIEEDGAPVQAIRRNLVIDIPIVDIQGLPEPARESAARRLAKLETQRPFDIAKDPLIRACYLRLAEENHIFLLSLHHIVSDEWSRGIFERELENLYLSFATGEKSSLAELEIQYADFACWQRRTLDGGALDGQIAYWKEQLQAAPSVLELPTDRPRPPARTSRGAIETLSIDKEQLRKLKELSRRHSVTLYMTLMSAFSALLRRYSNQTDITIGSFIANRNRPEIEGLIGFFVNTLVIRADLSGDPTFRELLGRIRKTTLDAFMRQDVPFEKLLECLGVERAGSHTPLFQVMLAHQNATRGRFKLRGLEISRLAFERTRTNFDLTLTVRERSEELDAALEYREDLFDRDTANRVLRHFANALDCVAVDPEQRISDLSLLTETERRQLLVEWNGAKREPEPDLCVHELFEKHAKSNPDAVAVEDDSGRLTYAELNRRANRLAHYLRGNGVKPDVPVGICMERSVEMIVAMLAVLKAGGAYLPLDPAYPADRIAYMIEDSGASIVVAGRAIASLPADQTTRVAHPDAEIIARQSDENPPRSAAAENLAYLIYTSGSTGKPKGVMVQHRSLANFTRTAIERYELTPEDRVLQFASISFDASAEEIYPCLAQGGTLALRNETMLSGARIFLDECARLSLSVLDLPTSYWHELIEEMGAEGLEPTAGIRLVIIGGEKAIGERRMEWDRLVGDAVRLVNTYGPTEATVVATMWSSDMAGPAEPPIGRAIEGVEIYALDENLQLAPIGAGGELHIGGAGLARGYLNQPALTAEKFIPHPYGDEAGARLYKTGDLARYPGAGQLEYLGRRDHQAKIRGYRIEPGEIEAVLLQQPGVKEAVVMAIETAPGEKKLTAYLALDENIAFSPDELRKALKRRMPDYMAPAAFVKLEKIPRTANGKVDRRALSLLDHEKLEVRDAAVPPRTTLEELLAGIWAESLQMEDVGIEENFFDLGGHSLLIIQVLSRIRQVFQVEVSLRSLFDAPTVAGMAEVVETAMLSNQPHDVSPIMLAPRTEKLFLSSAQERLWFLDQLSPGSSAYNIPTALRLRGRFNRSALEQSLGEIIRRHEILRTRFEVNDGRPIQTISPGRGLRLSLVDLESSPDQKPTLWKLIEREAARPFDLSREPAIRVSLLRTSAVEHVLLLTIHHIAGDAQSLRILMREMDQLYEAFSRGERSPLEELCIQYADYAQWQRLSLQSEAMKKQLDYWRKTLSEETPALDLPTDHARPAALSDRGGRQTVSISQAVSENLKQLSRRHGATLFMTMLAAFKVLLSRYSGCLQIVVGTPAAGRDRAETRNLIGFFVNTLALRTDLSGDPQFSQLLAREREVALEAYLNQDAPFERLVEELQPERDLSRSPLFQVMFTLQNASKESLSLAGLKMRQLKMDIATVHFELSLGLIEGKRGVSGVLAYSVDLYEAESIHRMIRHYENMLIGALAGADRRISELPLLSESETRQILVEWNDTAREYGEDRCLHQVFEEQVERGADRIAVIHQGHQLSYGELNRRANQLGHYLRGKGVGPEVMVGVSVDRSPEMLLALLGVLKAGGAYVPLDPGYPAQRLEYILEDAQVSLLMSVERLDPDHGQIQGIGEAEVIRLDADWEKIGGQSEDRVESDATSGNLAYLIYTSGSTGRPKGVAIEHRSAVKFLNWAEETFNPESTEIVAASTSICFDLSIFELFGPLSWGRKIALTKNALELAEMDPDVEVTLINTVPSAMKELIRLGGVPNSVRTVNLAGEALSSSLVQEIYRLGHIEAVYNLYGPSEDTTYSTFGLIGRGDAARVSIGRPTANTRAYILDKRMSPAPVGVRGELYLGGDGLARCYYRRAELTAERFLPDRYGARAGGRVYKTGDLTAYRADGEIDYLGRADDQVKIRGYRIELGEIESVMMSHPDIKEAAALVLEDGDGGKGLIGYVAPKQEGRLQTGELRSYLREKLPDYMAPGRFVVLESLPLTPNGKIDRKALRGLAVVDEEREAACAGPRNAVEEILAGIWSEVLRVEAVGVEENFFDLGGHSLLATQIVSRIRKIFQIEIPLRSLFESPTVAGLAQAVGRVMEAGQGRAVPSIEPVPRDQRLLLSSAQERLWFLHKLRPESSAYNLPWAMRLKGRLNAPALEQSLTEIIRRHESLRTTFRMDDGQPAQVIGPSLSLRLPIVDLQHLADQRLSRARRDAASLEAARPFDLSRGPALRARLLRIATDEHELLLTIHHISGDGWSKVIFARELTRLYGTFLNGGASPLKELDIQYIDYAQWQKRMLGGGSLGAQLSYWKEKLGGDLPVLELSTDRKRPAVQSDRGARLPVVIPASAAEGLRRLSRSEGITLFMTLLAAFKVLLSRYSGLKDIVVGTPIAGRNHAETENLIGLFVNTLALRTDLSGDPRFSQLLAREREVALEAYLNQDAPFERLVEELRPKRDLSHAPLFQVMFAFQNMPREAPVLPGLEISPVKMDAATAQFDLGLTLIEKDRELKGSLEYSTDLFDAESVRRMIGHYRELLEGVINSADRRISEASLLSEAEKRQLLMEWNGAVIEDNIGQTVHELFEGQLARAADRIAVVCEDEQLSYAELNRRANQLACELMRMGVRPDDMVGICMERSVEMIVALLAIIKAGGAYVPIDPAYPKQRIKLIIDDAELKTVLTQRRWAESLSAHGAPLISVDERLHEIQPESGQNFGIKVDRDNLVYMIYTSGSTGVPKGAQISHRGLANYITQAAKRLEMSESDSVLQFASLSFDTAAEEIFVTLTAGARLVLRSDRMLDSVERFLETCNNWGVSALLIATSYWHEMVAEIAAKALVVPQGLRLVYVGGERILVDRLKEWRIRASGVKLFNGYGPTELTIVALMEELKEDGGDEVTIGRAIGNTRDYILDEAIELTPVGVGGELYIGGDGLARGYLKRPDLTADSFVPDPFSREGGTRLYRTGDRAARKSDGRVSYLGRNDAQVKIRGYRVELGEIESALRDHPRVNEAVVVMRSDGAAEKQLVCFVVMTDAVLKTSELRGYLKERLPVYMIPSAFALLSALPTLPNGKVDRQALMALAYPRPESETDYVEPKTSLEKTIADIWSKVLRMNKLGMNDNFFDLGGSSLTLIQVSSRLKDTLEIEIPLIELFEYPTVNELAARLDRQGDRQHSMKQAQERATKQQEAIKRHRRALTQK